MNATIKSQIKRIEKKNRMMLYIGDEIRFLLPNGLRNYSIGDKILITISESLPPPSNNQLLLHGKAISQSIISCGGLLFGFDRLKVNGEMDILIDVE